MYILDPQKKKGLRASKKISSNHPKFLKKCLKSVNSTFISVFRGHNQFFDFVCRILMQFWSLGHFTLEIPSPTVRKDRRHIWPKMYRTKLESPRTIPTKLFFKKFFQIFFSAKISQFRYLIAYRYAQTRSFAIKLHVREYLNASSRAKVREYPFKSRISHQLARWRQCFYVFFNTLGHLNWIPHCWTVIAHCQKTNSFGLWKVRW